MRRTALSGLVFVLMAAFALPVAADELSDFESARRNYDRQNYAKATRGLESLVGGVVPRAANSGVRLEARKYLGATYLFLGSHLMLLVFSGSRILERSTKFLFATVMPDNIFFFSILGPSKKIGDDSANG